MSTEDIIRAWKDPKYRGKLSKKQLESLPPHPAGIIELNDNDLMLTNNPATQYPCTQGCTNFTCTVTCPTTAEPCNPC